MSANEYFLRVRLCPKPPIHTSDIQPSQGPCEEHTTAFPILYEGAAGETGGCSTYSLTQTIETHLNMGILPKCRQTSKSCAFKCLHDRLLKQFPGSSPRMFVSYAS